MKPFRFPSNRLSVADTDAIIGMIARSAADRRIEDGMRASGIRVTASEIQRIRRELAEDQNRARAAS